MNFSWTTPKDTKVHLDLRMASTALYYLDFNTNISRILPQVRLQPQHTTLNSSSALNLNIKRQIHLILLQRIPLPQASLHTNHITLLCIPRHHYSANRRSRARNLTIHRYCKYPDLPLPVTGPNILLYRPPRDQYISRHKAHHMYHLVLYSQRVLRHIPHLFLLRPIQSMEGAILQVI